MTLLVRGALPFALAIALLGFGLGCGDDDGSTDAGDAMVDTGPPLTIEEIPADETLSLPGLVGTVSAVQDARGMWHIYAESLEDAVRAQGYLMARDRWGQMDLIRRAATGRLGQIAGALDPGQIEADIDSRFVGYARVARQLLETLTAEELSLLDAFAAGINQYLAALRSGDEVHPRGVRNTYELLGDRLDDWAPIDTLAIARIQSAQLSFDMNDDINMTELREAVATAFPDTSTDPVLLARAGSFHDFAPYEPIFDVYSRDGFPNVGTDTGTRAIRRPRAPVTAHAPTPSPMQLRAARDFAERMERRYQEWFGDDTRGSNSWVVHGDQTASGHPILANDPHLALDSPGLFWMVHINTKRAGGEYDVEGLSLAGTPVVLLGYNEAVAWGLTTHGFDVTDSYLETITEVADGPDTVLYKGAQIPIQTVTENIESSDGTSMDVVFEYIEPADAVGGPRYIIPETRTPTSAISVKWTGFAPSNELRAFLELATATNVDDVRTAYENFGVGGQNLVAVTRDGDIFWSTQVNLPVRDARAMDYDPATGTGFAPCFVLPGTGEYEWIDMLSDQFLPHDQNPAKGFIATANNDGVGSISDGNPFDDDHYIGWNFNDGDRFARITERLEELTSGAETVTPEDMSAVQNDAVSPYGRLYTPAFIAELDRAIEEAATPGTHPDLETVVAAIAAADMAKIEDMRDRLAAWTSFDTPAAVEGAPTAQEIADSVATTIFNAAFGRILGLALSDEYEALDSWNGFRSRTFANMLLEPDGMVTYDATLRDGAGDSVLWDDITTAEIESRGQRILAGFVAALDYLETDVDADPNEWRWGRLHTLRLRTTVPQLGGDALSIPLPTDPMFPDGFPRHGDNGVVDASSYGIGDTTDFSYGSGPQQRLVVEMTPERPLIWNAIPGGQSIDPDSPHHADEIELWRTNQAPPMNWTEEEVLAAHERRIVFSP